MKMKKDEEWGWNKEIKKGDGGGGTGREEGRGRIKRYNLKLTFLSSGV